MVRSGLDIYPQLEMIALDHPDLQNAFFQDKEINQGFFAAFDKGWEFLWMLKKQGVFLAALPNIPLDEYMDLHQKINALKFRQSNLTKFDYWYRSFLQARLQPQPVCVHIKITRWAGFGETRIITLQEGHELIDPNIYIHEEI